MWGQTASASSYSAAGASKGMTPASTREYLKSNDYRAAMGMPAASKALGGDFNEVSGGARAEDGAGGNAGGDVLWRITRPSIIHELNASPDGTGVMVSLDLT
eukprot:CAMPEP_0180146618 /NCGR_PEP_ID=MMETSP0986-20121125/18639_1 /TAXON_ID=697907 /ORGANISM="non described non described, Strain CCMP2293" /LENGTH=101 /DNA_ID=CAMNT_0022091753 /DNA_START=26 /DNA_END=328 /DNA_ORIENTATION=+